MKNAMSQGKYIFFNLHSYRSTISHIFLTEETLLLFRRNILIVKRNRISFLLLQAILYSCPELAFSIMGTRFIVWKNLLICGFI